MRGIYCIDIGGKLYIGKDSNLESETRYRTHLNMLKQGTHYNEKMQEAFNNHKKATFKVLYKAPEGLSQAELDNKEREFIIKLDTLHRGLNKANGGGGGQNPSHGEDNGMAKISNADFYRLVDMLKEGKTNEEIGLEFNLHPRYVSLIRHRKRFKKLWETVTDYQPKKSSGTDAPKKLTFEQFVRVTKMLAEGATNAHIERTFRLASGTGSRIRHKKLYKSWWDML